MRKIVQVTDGNNFISVNIGGTPSSSLLLDRGGKLLKRSLVRTSHYLTHACDPGKYIVETDGNILSIEVKKIDRRPILDDVTPENLDEILVSAKWFDITTENEKLVCIKSKLINYFSDLSFQVRDQLIPNYKLQNALLGVYDKKTLSNYRLTIESFRKEFYRLKKSIEDAKTLEALKTIEPNFPKKIMSAE